MKKYTLDEILKDKTLEFAFDKTEELVKMGMSREEAWDASVHIIGGIEIFHKWLEKKEAK
jgi:hypothetical protein